MKYILLLILLSMTSCEGLNKELEAREKYSSNAERMINEMECHINDFGVCACIVTDHLLPYGLGLGLAIDPTHRACNGNK